MQYENKMARNFLWAVVFIVSLLTLVLGLFFSYRLPLTMWFLTPNKSIAELGTPEAPTYEDRQNWWLIPSAENEGNDVARSSNATVPSEFTYDVFYIHPTTYFNPNSWNAPLDDKNASDFLITTVLPQQIAPFEKSARVFAPKYRQATLAALRDNSASAREAARIARSDIFNAFDEYIRVWNGGRPFVIAAHSQGSFHGLYILNKIQNDPDLATQLIAAYLPGWPIGVNDQVALASISSCKQERDTHCYLSWNSFTMGSNPSDWLNHYQLWGSLAPDQSFELPMLCTNPLSWKIERESIYSGEDNRISYFNENGEFSSETLPLTATCGEDGVLYLDPFQHPSLFTNLLPDGNLHLYDYALFAGAIEDNVAARAAAWVANNMDGL